MNAAIVAAGKAAGILAFTEIKRWAKAHGKPMGEWRGTLVKEDMGGNTWKVGQDDADPRRLWIPAVGLEYSWAGGGWMSDGPSIPWAACKVLGCTRETFLEDGFLHDFGYRSGKLYARRPGGKWVLVDVTKHDVDVIFRVGLNASGANNAQEVALYAGVRTPFARAAWENWRSKNV